MSETVDWINHMVTFFKIFIKLNLVEMHVYAFPYHLLLLGNKKIQCLEYEKYLINIGSINNFKLFCTFNKDRCVVGVESGGGY